MKAIIINILFILIIPSQPIFAEEKSRYYNTYEVKIQIAQYDYKAMIYEPKMEKIKAILIISHTLGKSNSIEGSNAQYFSQHGYVAIVPYVFDSELDKLLPDTEKLDNDFLRPIPSVKSFIAIAESKFHLPKDLPIFALGASQGGITTLILTAYIPRIKAAWAAVGGGDLPYIYAHSDSSGVVKFRTNHMRFLNITDNNEYEAYLRANLKNDPVIVCREIKVPFHQTIALRDTTVPTVTQELLADQCPPHEIQRLQLTHTGGTLTTVTDRQKIKDFFEAEL